MFDLFASEYGWTDEQVLDLTFGQMRQKTAAILRRQWLAGLEARRLETAKLRTLCTYVASTMQVDPKENSMLTSAADLMLGPGTENPVPTGGPDGERDQRAPRVPVRPAGPSATLPIDQLPDGPVVRRAGDPLPGGLPAGVNPVKLHEMGTMFGGTL